MATQTRPVGQFDEGLISASYTYDDVTGRILSIIGVNTSLSRSLTITLRHPTTRVIYWTVTHPKNGGTRTWVEPEFPTSTLTSKANPKPPGTTIWAPNNLIELTVVQG